MPKIKTKKAVQKRIKITASGKLKRAQAGRSHLMRKKNSRRRLRLKRPRYMAAVNEKKVKEMLPYG
ncbi:MAG TPA: 50S ribosomal protein L35 [Candidatus Omnitrophica bacterium]|nr:50S ribosomal protein L35 [Candidatus Omnitrophota bacterium]